MIALNLLQILKNNANILYAKYIKKDDIETLPIFYIGGSQTLPPPLSPAEEEDAIKKLANGDLETRQLLVERNLRLVVYIAKKFENVSGYSLADVPYASSFAGFKDFFIQKYQRPGFTIEAGLGENPLSLSQFNQIYKDNIGILVLGGALI